MKSEATALMLSTVAALLMGVVGVVAAVITNSQAILLDGLFKACYFVTAMFTLRVAQLLKRPDDAQFPFGYLYFEPLINAVKGLLILGVALFALIDAALTILAGGRDIAVGGAIGYAAFATALCLAMALLLRRARRHVVSPLVNADVENWSVMIAADLREAALYRSNLGQPRDPDFDRRSRAHGRACAHGAPEPGSAGLGRGAYSHDRS
jgi:predicted Co/Zn/Cd cation transporter (cation efflux family)